MLAATANYLGPTMMSFERLDAWKVSHELALAVYQATDRIAEDKFEECVDHLRLAAILAPAKLAHGSARRSRKAFQRFVEMAMGYLAEMGYCLRLAGERGVLPENDVRQLSALRGRATFYTWKLFLTLAPSPDTDPPRDH